MAGDGEARLDALRKELARRGLDGFVIPISDEHMSEYVGAYAQRLAWLTGFQGSAGSAVVLPADAAIFVDGRYTLQVREQVDLEAEDLVVLVERHLRLRQVVAAVRVGEEGLGAVGGPLHRPADFLRRP